MAASEVSALWEHHLPQQPRKIDCEESGHSRICLVEQGLGGLKRGPEWRLETAREQNHTTGLGARWCSYSQVRTHVPNLPLMIHFRIHFDLYCLTLCQ